jgi:ferredoxin
MQHAAIVILVLLLGLGAAHLYQRFLGYDYRCNSCGTCFSISPAAAMVLPHRLGGVKLTRCPQCQALRWATPVGRSTPLNS